MDWLREPDTEPLPGYRLIEPIGTGGFGEVWKCIAPGGIHKAIKFVFGNLNALDGDDARAVQELKALERVKQVRHPFVLSIEQIQVVGGELVIVMELADKNLHECLVEYQANGRPGIPRDILVGYLDDAAGGLDHLIEKHNLQHLDVKPRNLFTVADRVKVADFGLVKQLERSSASGLMGGVTPLYAAPETFQNKISKHSDQYSLAIVYVEMLTGQRPFKGKNVRQLALQHMTEVPDLSILPEVDRPVVARALAKNPDERWPSCSAFIRALAGTGGGNGSSGGEPGTSARDPSSWTSANHSVLDVDLAPLGARQNEGGVATYATPSRRKVKPLPEIDEEHLLGMTVPKQDLGVLRPTVLIGIGSFGRRALQELRCRLIDCAGDAAQVPCFRFLYVDCDPDAVTKATSAPPDVALTAEEVFAVPLQQVTQYRRRQLDQILDWLPREKLYSIPRNLHAGGSRSLARLAFCDNYLRFATRLRREFQIATHPESLAQSSAQTGLAVRENTPRVFVFASASGGSGGMLVDLGYAVQRVLARMTPLEPSVTAFVYVAAPNDPNSKDHELANLYASITELNHYSDPEVSFVAHYGGVEGPQVESRSAPFSSTYLLPLKDRRQRSFQDCVSHLATYVTHDMTTPLGPTLEAIRSRPAAYDRSPFRSFGTYGVWYPRGLLLRAAAQKICLSLLKEWKTDAEPIDPTNVKQLLQHAIEDPRLKPDDVRKQIELEAGREPDGGPAEQIERWLSGLESQVSVPSRIPDAGSWSHAVWEQARDLVGLKPTGELDSAVRRSRTSKPLDDAINRVAEAWGNEFAEVVRPLEQMPGRRLGAIGMALKKLMAMCNDRANAADTRVQQIAEKATQAISDVDTARHNCKTGGGFSLFGRNTARNLRQFLDQIRAFARIRMQEDLADSTAKFYRALRTRVEDRLGELAYCSNRIDLLIQAIESPLANLPMSTDTPIAITTEEVLQKTLHPTATLNVVLPNGETHIDRSAKRIISSLKTNDMMRMEVALQKLVLIPRGGLTSLCLMNADLGHTLYAPMVEQAIAFLSDHLPVTDVTEVEVSTSRAQKIDLPTRIEDYYNRSSAACGSDGDEQTFVLIPETESGRTFGSLVKKVVPSATTIPVDGTATDLMFCREHDNLRPDEVASLMAACQPAYLEALSSAQTATHSRFDVTAWLPLNE